MATPVAISMTPMIPETVRMSKSRVSQPRSGLLDASGWMACASSWVNLYAPKAMRKNTRP